MWALRLLRSQRGDISIGSADRSRLNSSFEDLVLPCEMSNKTEASFSPPDDIQSFSNFLSLVNGASWTLI